MRRRINEEKKINKRKIIIILIIVLIIIISTGVCFFIKCNNDKKFIKEVKSHYHTFVKIKAKANLYNSKKEVIGKIYKEIDTKLENKEIKTTKDNYFKIDKTNIYVYYKDIKKGKENKQEENNYLVFNEDLTTKKETIFYIDGKKIIKLNIGVKSPILRKDEKYYYVNYLNNSLSVEKDKAKVVKGNNTEEKEAEYISVINYNKIYDKNDTICSDNNCSDITFVNESLDYLKENGYYTITIEEFENWKKDYVRLKEKAILLFSTNDTYSKEIMDKYQFNIINFSDNKLVFKNTNKKNIRDEEYNIYNIRNNTLKEDFTRMVGGEEVEERVIKQAVSNKQSIAVLNYHFFYDSSLGETNCNENICLDTKRFRQQLDYLRDNGYKTLTIDEFAKWMYGEITLPEKSVLITIDDGAMGTSKINGNKLIPLLEEYKMHATLFLITEWWDKSNYSSPYLDVESHGNDIHITGSCGKAKIHCLSKEELKQDFSTSIDKLGTKTAFCYPFYTYNNTAIEVISELGFKVAFAGGGRKARQTDNKYLVPRYPIYDSTSIEEFIRMVS